MSPKTDLTGQKFGELTVIALDMEQQQRKAKWICLCSCGKQTSVAGYNLKNGNTRSCGCKMRKGGLRKDLEGSRFGKLFVIALDHRDRSGKAKWLCKCDCGGTTVVDGYKLTNGETKSCGCLVHEKAWTYTFKHGGKKDGTHLYQTWKGIKARCLRPNCREYKWYGARGISIFPEWEKNYPAFRDYILQNLGPRPPELSLDRINNDGNYEPGNLRWATRSEQIKNSRWCLDVDKRHCKEVPNEPSAAEPV